MNNKETPKLLAEFELDEAGQPKYISGDNEKHYKLRLFVKDAPSDASSVKYFLHPTYIEPVRQVLQGTEDFGEYLTSWGNYEVRAVVNRKSGREWLSRSLADALGERYQGNLTDPIKSAIDRLKEH